MPTPATNTPPDYAALIATLAGHARHAYAVLSSSPPDVRNAALAGIAAAVRAMQGDILTANAMDVTAARAKGLSDAMIDRLMLNPERIEGIARAVETLIALPDPLHRTLAEWTRPNGLTIRRISIPLGVVGVIYESRPNVTVDAAALCLKSGNGVILRGGSESLATSRALMSAIHRGLDAASLPRDAVQLIDTPDRAAVSAMLQASGLIDVIIPRGGKSLTERVQAESRVPTILHLDGNCHTYLHAAADPQMAAAVTLNAKLRRTGICGATESLVVDQNALETVFVPVAKQLLEKGCEIRADAPARAAFPDALPATEADWGTEYLAPVISVKTVADVAEAVAHINRYGSHHTDAIITQDAAAAAYFLEHVDSAIVLHNASTQFADGGEFGFGGEIGIATGRLHARGPVGCEQLTTYKYVVRGTGHTRP